MRTTTVTLSRPVLWALVLLLGMGILLPAERVPAQESGCIAVDMNDQPRNCTFLESHGACLWGALDSYDACLDGVDGFFDRVACELGVQVDLLACNLGLPWRLLKSLME